MRRSVVNISVVFGIAAMVIVWLSSPARGDTGTPDVKFLDQLATAGIPAAYGEVLGALTEGAGDALKEGVVNKSGDIAKLANQSVWRDKISRVNQAIGRLAALLDVGGKTYAGQYDDAAVSAGLAVLTELAGTESGKALLSSYGITPPVVTAVVVAVQVWWESHKALARETMGRQLQSLYSAVETMTRSSGKRTLGEGDPFPVTPENVEKVWQRILNDPTFRDLFRVYVTEQLGQTFPEPGFFDKFDVYIAEPAINVLSGSSRPKDGYAAAHLDSSRAATPATSADRLEEVERQRIKEQYDEIKPYIAGLVGTLNRAAKIREQQVAAQRKLLELQACLQSGGSIEEMIKKIEHALAMSGVVETYLARAGSNITKAAEEEDYQTLQVHMKMATDYVRDVVAWLPNTGPTAELHLSLLEGLKGTYAAARSAFEAFRGKLRQQMEKMEPPKETQEEAAAEVKIDPTEYFNSHFKPLIKPFEWGGAGDPAAIRHTFQALLEEGLFAFPDGSFVHTPGRRPLADIAQAAWEAQNFALAADPASAPEGKLPAPDPKGTIEGYRSALAEKIDKEERKIPDGITSLERTLKEQGEANSRKWREGNDLYWGRNPKPPADETKEQAKARRDRGMAIMDAASKAGEALKPSHDRLAAMKKAWADALEMAHSQAAYQVMELEMDYQSVSIWMTGLKAEFRNRAFQAESARKMLASQLAALSLAPEDAAAAVDVAPELATAAATVEANAYTRLGAFSKPRESSLDNGLRRLMNDQAGKLTEKVRSLRSTASWAGGKAYALADAYTDGCETWDRLLARSAAEIAEIQQLVNPGFLAGDPLTRRRSKTPALAKMLRVEADKIISQAEAHAANMESDAHWLRQVAANFDRFIQLGSSLGVLEQSGSYGEGGTIRAPKAHGGEPLVVSYPYRHYLTQAEKGQISAQLRQIWDGTNLKPFADKLAPWLAETVRQYFSQLDQIPTHAEENFLIETTIPVTPSGLDRAKSIMANAAPGTPAFEPAFKSLAAILPMEIHYYKENNYAPTFGPVTVPEGLSLARRYLEFRDSVIKAYESHVVLWAAYVKRQEEAARKQASQELPGLVDILTARHQKGKLLIEKALALPARDRAALKAAIDSLEAFRSNELLADPYHRVNEMAYSLSQGTGKDAGLARQAQAAVQAMGQLSGDLATAAAKLRTRLAAPLSYDAEARDFYQRFKAAYEARDAVQVMRFIGDDWSAGDGTTLMDLEVLFSRMFDMFDDIRLDMSGLKVETIGEDRVRTSYSLTITGRIFRHNLKHVEKSSVTEEIAFQEDGGRVVRTLQGSFWYIE